MKDSERITLLEQRIAQLEKRVADLEYQERIKQPFGPGTNHPICPPLIGEPYVVRVGSPEFPPWYITSSVQRNFEEGSDRIQEHTEDPLCTNLRLDLTV